MKSLRLRSPGKLYSVILTISVKTLTMARGGVSISQYSFPGEHRRQLLTQQECDGAGFATSLGVIELLWHCSINILSCASNASFDHYRR